MRLALLFFATLAAAQEHGGHSMTGAALGIVEFPTSCSATAQQQITRAVALLHSFGYEESRLGFQAAADSDPSCGIALWGVAPTWYHPVWAPPLPNELQQGAAALARAQAVGAKTSRERDYIDSLAVFYRNAGTIDHTARAKAYEQALGKLPRHPNHPGLAHYIIHATDYPSTAELGLAAARAYAKIAPDASHALHMLSHIFTRLGLWDDCISSNIAAAKSALERTQRLHGGGGSFDQLHAMDYLVYAYLQEGRYNSAQRVLTEMAALTRLDENQFAAAYAFAASPARLALERDWKAAAAAADREDDIDKHPVTPGALLPVREILADLLLDAGDAAAALREYETVLKSCPRRLNATAGAAKAAAQSKDDIKARAYALPLKALTAASEVERP